VERRFVWISDPSAVTVGELRDAADRVEADLAVVVWEGQPIVAIHRGDLVDAAREDSIGPLLEHLPALEDAPFGAFPGGGRVGFEAEFAVVVVGDDTLLVPTPGELGWADVAGADLVHAFAPLARLPGEITEPPDPKITCFCRFGDTVKGPASNPPSHCAKGHPVLCEE
jgi:hypothetical protein